MAKTRAISVQVDLEGDFYVTNGGLSSVYKSVQFHFHWGHAAHHGSEHRIDGKTSPIEVKVWFSEQSSVSQPFLDHAPP